MLKSWAKDSVIVRLVDAHFFWINPTLTATSTISGAMLTYTLTPDYYRRHPIQAAFLEQAVSYSPLMLLSSVTILCLIFVIKYFSEQNIADLRNEVLELRERSAFLPGNVRSVFEGFLYRFGTKINFGSMNENNERVTLYFHDAARDRFVTCARYSPNPRFKAAGRPEYPINEGCIAKGWEHGWHFDNAFPSDPSERASRHAGGYGMPRRTANNLKMPSRLYAAMRINDVEDRPIAVMVVESTEQERWSEDALRAEMQDQVQYLGELVGRLKEYIPIPSNAGSKGL